MIYFQLFISFLKIGLFSFGGGYATIPLIEEAIRDYGWLTRQQFNDLVTISQLTPGPIALNAATFVGLKAQGLEGALIATLGCILPSCIIVGAISYGYFKYRKLPLLQKVLKTLRPAVIAMIASAALLLLKACFFQGQNFELFALCNFLIAMILLRKFKMNPILVILISGILQVLIDLI